MLNEEDLDVKSRQQLYSIINKLNISVDRLEKEKQLLKIILNKFEKFYKYFDEISETFLSNEVLNARNEIKQLFSLNSLESKVSVKKLTESQLKCK